MDPLISLPRQALADLLAAAGSTLTPEQFIASLPASGPPKKYASRARAAAWSKPVLVLVTVLSVAFTLFSFDLENLIILIGLAAVTFFEYRTHRYFLEGNPLAPSLGFRNQSCFALGILVYGFYHAFFPTKLEIPSEYREVMDPSTSGMVQSLELVFYLFIGLVGGLSQFGLAWYYRSAGPPALPPVPAAL